MTQEFRFVYRRLGIKEILIVNTVIHKSVDSEIAYSERSQVLEEVCALTRIYAVISQTGFHYHTGSRNMRPFHRNTQPCIAASPTSRTDKYIILTFIQELPVDFFFFLSNSLIVRSTVTLSLYIDNIVNFVHNAMSQRIIRTKDNVLIPYLIQIFIQHFLTIHNWPDL